MKKLILFFTTMALNGQNCESTFWTVNTNNNIMEWNLNSGVITGGNIVLTANFITTGLAYALDNNETTFFCGDFSQNLKKYNSITGWTNVLSNTYVSNVGGYHNKLYYANGNGGVTYYDGSNITNFIIQGYMIADIAVDSQGRAWIFYGTNGTSTSNLLVYDGINLVESYTISFNTNNTYGSFFLNDNLYIMKGNQATSNPNTIIPVIINGTSASLGVPINFNCPNCHDAASCNVNQLSLNEVNLYSDSDLVISPNPTWGITTVYSEVQIKESKVFSIDGKLIKDSMHNIIDLSNVKNGVYLVTIQTINNKLYTKLIKKN